jgi:hypothetical protein
MKMKPFPKKINGTFRNDMREEQGGGRPPWYAPVTA